MGHTLVTNIFVGAKNKLRVHIHGIYCTCIDYIKDFKWGGGCTVDLLKIRHL